MMSEQTTTSEHLITGEELLRMPDTERCELVQGQIVNMSPTGWKHGRIEYLLARHLDDFVQDQHLGTVVVGEVGMYVARDPDTVRAADIVFISTEGLEKASPDGYLDVSPDLVVEIMSPTNRWMDVRQKIEEYLAAGVGQVWIVEPENQSVQVYRAPDAVHTFSGPDVLHGEGMLAGFSLPLEDLFAE